MQKIPYGISDFSDIATEDYFFVDRTQYIQKLETLGEKYLFFLRPRRFGKSLWISILQHYYGIEHKGDFEDLFGKYYIGQHPTPLANSYLVLRIEFSRIDTTTPEGTFSGFLRNVKKGVRDLIHTYPAFLPAEYADGVMAQSDPASVLVELFARMNTIPGLPGIYLLIDEYDHFANELVSFNLDYFSEIVARNGFVRKFYETLKTATGEGILDRIFITGVTPLTLDSLTSGFNIGSDLSRDEDLQAMMGFTGEEVSGLLSDVGVSDSDLEETLGQVKKWYNGYQFSIRPSNGRLYNPDMVLYFAKHYLRYRRAPDEMLDTNIASDYGKIKKLFSIGGMGNERFDVLERLLDSEEIAIQLTPEFSFEKAFDTNDFLSLLYYMGLLTIRGHRLSLTSLGIPNQVIRKLYFDYFGEWVNSRIESPPNSLKLQEAMLGLAEHNRPRPLLEIVAQTLQQLSNRDWLQFDEKHVKMVLVSYLYSSALYFIKSEFESGQKYLDILLLRRPPFPAPYQFAFELKYLRQKDAAKLPEKIEEGRKQLQIYLREPDLSELESLKAWLIVFVGPELKHIEEVG